MTRKSRPGLLACKTITGTVIHEKLFSCPFVVIEVFIGFYGHRVKSHETQLHSFIMRLSETEKGDTRKEALQEKSDLNSERGRCRQWEKRKMEKIKCRSQFKVQELQQLKWLTIRGFLSGQGLALSVAIASKHRHLIACLRGEAVQNCGGGVSCYCLLPGLLGEQRLPRDPVMTNVAGSRHPRRGKTVLCDVFGHQVSGWTELCE